MRTILQTLAGAVVLVFVASGCSARVADVVTVADGTPLAQIRAEARTVRNFVTAPAAKRFLETADYLPVVEPRTLHRDPETREIFTAEQVGSLSDEQRARLTEKSYDEAYYYMTRYGTPVSYARALDLVAGAGMSRFSGKRVLDFGYGTIGQLRMMALMGADVTGVEVDPLLPVLYGFPGDQGPVPAVYGPAGSVRLIHGRYPADLATKESVGGRYDLIISKNVLKRGYIHPAREVDERMTIKLGVDDETFVATVYAALNPGGVFIIYNMSPKQNPPDKPYIPWADGESPFSRDVLEAAGFEVLAFDRDDSAAARELGTLLEWDTKQEMDLQSDLFARVMICRK